MTRKCTPKQSGTPKCIIDEEFESLLPPLLPEEYEGLKRNIAKAGTCDSLTVWAEMDILIDGHHRRRICDELSIKPPVNRLSFVDRGEVIAWMLDYQRSRRNMNKFRWAEAALNQKERVALQAKENQRSGGKGLFLNSGKVHTDKILAKRAGVSHDTLTKVAYIMDNARKKTIEALRRGDAGVSIHGVFTELKEQEVEMEAKFTPKAKKKSRKTASSVPLPNEEPSHDTLKPEIDSAIEFFTDMEQRLSIEDSAVIYEEVGKWMNKRKVDLVIELM